MIFFILEPEDKEIVIAKQQFFGTQNIKLTDLSIKSSTYFNHQKMSFAVAVCLINFLHQFTLINRPHLCRIEVVDKRVWDSPSHRQGDFLHPTYVPTYLAYQYTTHTYTNFYLCAQAYVR